MGFFHQEEEWDLLDEDGEFLEDPIEEDKPKKEKKKKEKKNKQTNKSNKKKAKRKELETEERNYQEESEIEDDLWEEEEEAGILQRYWYLCVLFLVVLIGGFGALNTDFSNGKAYIVPLNIHYERSYVSKADHMLDIMLQNVDYISYHTADLPSNYLDESAQLQSLQEELKNATDDLSRYTDVPESMSGYHQKLLNCSIGVQKLVDDLLKNYANSDYLDWREAAIVDMQSSIASIQTMRSQIQQQLLRNQKE